MRTSPDKAICAQTSGEPSESRRAPAFRRPPSQTCFPATLLQDGEAPANLASINSPLLISWTEVLIKFNMDCVNLFCQWTVQHWPLRIPIACPSAKIAARD
jgi:hypothetical protein